MKPGYAWGTRRQHTVLPRKPKWGASFGDVCRFIFAVGCIRSSMLPSMNYYKRHIGDYIKDTAHLSLLEHGVYTRLLDVYYGREGPILESEAARLIGARTAHERTVMHSILVEFFTQEGDAWRHGRCDEEIVEARESGEENAAKRENEKERQRRHRQRRKALFEQLRSHGVVPKWDTSTEQLETELSQVTQHSSNAPVTEPVTRTATAIHKPVTSNHKPEELQKLSEANASSPGDAGSDPPPLELNGHQHASVPDCPHRDIIAAYHEALPALPSVRVELWGGSRAKALQARWRWVLTAKKSTGERYATSADDALDWFRRYFAYASKARFPTGVNGTWTPDLGWLLNAENFAKVLQGNYHGEQNA